jgi:hypothetical protein
MYDGEAQQSIKIALGLELAITSGEMVANPDTLKIFTR